MSDPAVTVTRMGLERIDLLEFHDLRRKTAFATVREPLHRYAKVTTGVLADGRFFVERIGRSAAGKPWGGAWVFYGEEQAVRVADRCLVDGRRWEQVPAQWDGRGQPCDNHTWHKAGNQWRLGPGPDAG